MNKNNYISKFFLQGFALSLIISFCICVKAQDEDDEGNANQTAAIKLFERAQDEHEKGNLQEAVKFYDEAIKLSPEFPEAEYQRATALILLKRFEEAEKGFRRAIELRADWSLPYSALGSLLVKLNRHKDAESILTEALKLDANSYPALLSMLDLRLQTKASKEQLVALLNQFRNATAGTKVPVAVWIARGKLERIAGTKENAKISLDRALMADPVNFSALAERSALYEDIGDYEHALEDAKALQKIEPKLSSVSINVARIYAKMGKNDDALGVLDSLDETAKHSSEAQTLRASLVKCESTPETLAALEKALETQPKNGSLLACLGYGYRTVDAARSVDFYRRAAELEPTNIGYATGYAAALVQARKFETAIAILRRIINFAPDDYVAHANLATALYELRQYPEALTQFRWLAAAKPDIPVTYFYIATAHDSMQEYKDALPAYEKFLSIADPKQNQLEIEKVNLRLPILKKQISRGEGKKKP